MEIPLFPLNAVLFPGGPLALRIFEPRYLDMISRCLQQESCFGVVAIKHGSVIGAADLFAVGTLAAIVDWHQESDGLLGIAAAGRGRFAVEHVDRRQDGLYVGQVSLWDAESPVPLPDEHAPLAGLLRKLLAPDSSDRDLATAYADAVWVGYRLAEILPLPLPAKQMLLETRDALVRLEQLSEKLRAPEARERG
ncbi:MAG TPA: LON peptidase substrate-binding domain-containing protein [Gammaproteobacteria bacterium]|nr:LON peptidase substrate-binding domain-containing protein [Gammaproteobacteria bacterium]